MKRALFAAAFAAMTLSAPAGAALIEYDLAFDFSRAGGAPQEVVNANFVIDTGSDGQLRKLLSFNMAIGSTTYTLDNVITTANAAGVNGSASHFVVGGAPGATVHNLVVGANDFKLVLGQATFPSLSTGRSLEYSVAGADRAWGTTTVVVNQRPFVAAPPAGAVPEPATWAMMIGGFGLVGGAMRRRARTAVLA